MEDTLEFSGKKYISSKRAAASFGYTKDYVGQLARAGKIDARLVGRSWYVAEESISAHKNEVHYTLTQPFKERKKVESADTTEREPLFEKPKHAAPPSDDLVVEITRRTPTSTAEQPELAEPAAATPNHETHRDPLTASDIRFEPGTPVFYEDTRPLLPPQRREGNRYAGEPLPRPQTTSPARGAFRPVAAAKRSSAQSATAHVDGIRVPNNVRDVAQFESPRNLVHRKPGSGKRLGNRSDANSQRALQISVWVALIAIISVGLAYIFIELFGGLSILRLFHA